MSAEGRLFVSGSLCKALDAGRTKMGNLEPLQVELLHLDELIRTVKRQHQQVPSKSQEGTYEGSICGGKCQ